MANPNVLSAEEWERQLASVVHAARVAGPFDTSRRDTEESLQNAKRKLLTTVQTMREALEEIAAAGASVTTGEVLKYTDNEGFCCPRCYDKVRRAQEVVGAPGGRE